MPHAVVERVEPRQLYSAVLNNLGHVVITGTEAADAITVARVSTNAAKYAVNVNGAVTIFRVADVQRFRIAALGGADTITIDPQFGPIPVWRFVACGGGNDAYNGSQGRDVVEGGAGRDVIFGGAGRDFLTGEAGNDTIVGNGDSDFLAGGSDHDSLVGNDGDDTIEGNGGDDNLSGGNQDDSLSGGTGADLLVASLGRDFCAGDYGNDLIEGGAGNDFLYGGSENDTVIGGGGNDVVAGDGENRLFPDRPFEFQAGDDIISGGAGDDVLLSRNGRDTLTGGTGIDRFDSRGDGEDPNNDLLIDRQPGEPRPLETFLSGPAAFFSEIALMIHIDLEDTGILEQMFIKEGQGAVPDGTSFAEALNRTGRIQFRDTAARAFALGEFFTAWGVTFDATHIGQHVVNGAQTLTMTVNGVPNFDFNRYQIADGDQIVITFV